MSRTARTSRLRIAGRTARENIIAKNKAAARQRRLKSKRLNAKKDPSAYDAVSIINNYQSSLAIPSAKYVKLKYCQILAINETAAWDYVATFSLNSLYDPDYSLGGHQPMGFDQWTTFYKNYIVNAAKITVSTVNSHGSITAQRNPGFQAMWPCGINVAAAVTPLQEVFEYQNVTGTMIGYYAGKPSKMQAYINIPKALGLTKEQYDPEIYGAEVTANPSLRVNYAVQVTGDVSNATTEVRATTMVEIEFYAKFYNPQIVGPS